MVTISCASRAALASSIAVLLTFGLSGCATTWRPIPLTPRVALTPTKGDVTTQARPGAPIGGIVPVDVSLKAGLTGAAKNLAIGAIAGAATGAAIGAAVGTIVLSPAQGALVGAAIGGSVGAASGGVYGGVQGQAAAHRDAETQISALSLQTREAHPNYSINGYVFFPKGEYTSIQMTLLNEETHRTDVRTSSWEGGEIATGAGSATPMSVSPTPASPNVAQPSPAPLFQEQRQNETE